MNLLTEGQKLTLFFQKNFRKIKEGFIYKPREWQFFRVFFENFTNFSTKYGYDTPQRCKLFATLEKLLKKYGVDSVQT